MQIILASSSPRRQELMKMFNVPFEVIVKNTKEELDSSKSVYEQCMHIAYEKAMAVYQDIKDDVVVIGSDTIVSFNNKIYGKPKDYDDAFHMLKEFSGNCHEVISSLCVLIRKNGREYQELTYDKCDVHVNIMNDSEIEEWINSSDVYTKAGAYAIQEGYGKYVEKIDGDYFSIVGFPIHKLYEILKKYDVLKK